MLLGITTLFCFFNTGCLDKQSNKQMVEEYLKDYGVSNFTVSETYKESKTKYPDPDEVWTVELDDGSGITFHVINKYGYDEEFYSSRLTTDYDDQVVKYLFKKQGKLSDLNIVNNKVTANYNSGEKLSKVVEESELFLNYIRQSGYKVDVEFNFVLDNSPYNYFIRVDKNNLSFSANDYKDIFTDYVVTVLNYRLEDYLKDVQNYSSYMYDYKYKLAYKDSSGNYIYYSDLIAYNSSEITFKTLYEILKRNNYAVSGDINNFEFSTENGKCVYDETKSETSYCLNYANNDLESGDRVSIDIVNQIIGMDLKIGNNR